MLMLKVNSIVRTSVRPRMQINNVFWLLRVNSCPEKTNLKFVLQVVLSGSGMYDSQVSTVLTYHEVGLPCVQSKFRVETIWKLFSSFKDYYVCNRRSQ